MQPNRVHQILYAGTLQSYVCGELIGKTLVEKTATAVQLVLTDYESALDARHKLSMPVAWLANKEDSQAAANLVRPATKGQGAIYCHSRFPGDAAVIQELLERLDPTFDVREPFSRIREAAGEARKLSAIKSAA